MLALVAAVPSDVFAGHNLTLAIPLGAVFLIFALVVVTWVWRGKSSLNPKRRRVTPPAPPGDRGEELTPAGQAVGQG